MPGENEIKGQGFRGLLAAIEALHGKAALDATIEALPEDLRNAVRHGGIVSAGWYPIAWYRALHAAARQAVPGVPGLARALAYEQTRRDLGGVYRFFFRFLSTGWVLQQSERFFELYNRGGRVRVTDRKRGFARVTYSGCRGADLNVWEDVMGSAEALLAACGAEHVRIHLRSGGRDDDADMVTDVRWHERGAVEEGEENEDASG